MLISRMTTSLTYHVAFQRDTIISEFLFPPPKIVIANNKDSYGGKAVEDGFEVTSNWEEIASAADVVFLLVPDQVGIHLPHKSALILNKTGAT
jgi:hypothetical protein